MIPPSDGSAQMFLSNSFIESLHIIFIRLVQ